MVSSAARSMVCRRPPASRTRLVRRVLAASAASVLLTTLLTSGVAWAQPAAADRETARSLMQEGRDLRDKGHSQDALKRFKAADDIMHVPTTGLEVAKTQASMGMLVEARDTIANIRKLPTSPSDPAPFQDARNKADELDTALEGRIPALTIIVTGAGEGETPTIVVDGLTVPAAVVGLPRKVNPGKHLVTAKTPSGRGEQSVEVKEGEQKEVHVALGGADSSSVSDGGDVQPTHTESGGETSGPKSHSPNLVTWIGVGVAGAGILAGSITGAMSMSLTSQIKSKNECPNSVCVSGKPGGNDYASATSLATISDVSFVVAGIGAGVAVASLIIGHSEGESAAKPPEGAQPPAEGEPPASDTPAAPQSRLRVVPWIGLGSAGVTGVF